ncbi:hypothetical protein PACILC2_32620 [Paenibacillus cisolokensis]|uniref:Uncharacterized protein n=1 Tax=Paenibacillus cisolokensis TaxID=1658519 RepID=A0ABQ4N8Y1_9BACL|nr:hypothetical protein PACILC2_32620 [Paenibacillus cisolokensis]
MNVAVPDKPRDFADGQIRLNGQLLRFLDPHEGQIFKRRHSVNVPELHDHVISAQSRNPFKLLMPDIPAVMPENVVADEHDLRFRLLLHRGCVPSRTGGVKLGNRLQQQSLAQHPVVGAWLMVMGDQARQPAFDGMSRIIADVSAAKAQQLRRDAQGAEMKKDRDAQIRLSFYRADGMGDIGGMVYKIAFSRRIAFAVDDVFRRALFHILELVHGERAGANFPSGRRVEQMGERNIRREPAFFRRFARFFGAGQGKTVRHACHPPSLFLHTLTT